MASLMASQPQGEEKKFEDFLSEGFETALSLYHKVRAQSVSQMSEQAQKDANLPGTYLLVLPSALRDENGLNLLRQNPAPGSTRIQ